MGQYFLLVNKSKKEYICPHCIECGAKLWEWCASIQSGIALYLLRTSSERGGGDIDDIKDYPSAGRWAGDKIYLVGDYDKSKLYHKARKTYKNISIEVMKEYQKFIGKEIIPPDARECKACKSENRKEDKNE